jgi:hypothetical protein
MFVGHYAAGLAIGARVRGAPVAALLAATMVLDLVHLPLRMLGIEPVVVSGPSVFANWNLVQLGYSHSLVVSIVYSVALGGLAGRWWRSGAVGTAIGLAVFSHYVLDVLTHKPDMPVVGLGFTRDLTLGTNLAVHPLPFFLIELAWCVAAWLWFDRSNRRLPVVLAVWMAIWANGVFGFAVPREPLPPMSEAVAALIGVGLAGVSLWWAARPTVARDARDVSAHPPRARAARL